MVAGVAGDPDPLEVHPRPLGGERADRGDVVIERVGTEPSSCGLLEGAAAQR
jgi:hypothetical protein